MATGIAFGVAKMVLSTTAQQGGAIENKEASKAAKLGTNYEAGEYLTNINSEGGLRFVKVKIIMELSNEKVKGELENKRPKVDDTIISILRNKSFEEFRQVDATDKLKTELKEKINTFLAEGRVENVFFTYFITQ
jgi:flagellar FliL protein